MSNQPFFFSTLPQESWGLTKEHKVVITGILRCTKEGVLDQLPSEDFTEPGQCNRTAITDCSVYSQVQGFNKAMICSR